MISKPLTEAASSSDGQSIFVVTTAAGTAAVGGGAFEATGVGADADGWGFVSCLAFFAFSACAAWPLGGLFAAAFAAVMGL